MSLKFEFSGESYLWYLIENCFRKFLVKNVEVNVNLFWENLIKFGGDLL